MTRTAPKIAQEPQSELASMTRSGPIIDEEASAFDETAVATLIAFFRLLDEWDVEARGNAEIM